MERFLPFNIGGGNNGYPALFDKNFKALVRDVLDGDIDCVCLLEVSSAARADKVHNELEKQSEGEFDYRRVSLGDRSYDRVALYWKKSKADLVDLPSDHGKFASFPFQLRGGDAAYIYSVHMPWKQKRSATIKSLDRELQTSAERGIYVEALGDFNTKPSELETSAQCTLRTTRIQRKLPTAIHSTT
eukprot:TRINITY_DN2045_c1_g1_i1.p1 TRINITY_DN2045_c1_g1~~TRINITY_DN2045_c1_g1_i1.p1  ORF type:complete len:187 (-),score=21.18 TRINITY_DN2045_c1_g1_i1:338-898(-)